MCKKLRLRLKDLGLNTDEEIVNALSGTLYATRHRLFDGIPPSEFYMLKQEIGMGYMPKGFWKVYDLDYLVEDLLRYLFIDKLKYTAYQARFIAINRLLSTHGLKQIKEELIKAKEPKDVLYYMSKIYGIEYQEFINLRKLDIMKQLISYNIETTIKEQDSEVTIKLKQILQEVKTHNSNSDKVLFPTILKNSLVSLYLDKNVINKVTSTYSEYCVATGITLAQLKDTWNSNICASISEEATKALTKPIIYNILFNNYTFEDVVLHMLMYLNITIDTPGLLMYRLYTDSYIPRIPKAYWLGEFGEDYAIDILSQILKEENIGVSDLKNVELNLLTKRNGMTLSTVSRYIKLPVVDLLSVALNLPYYYIPNGVNREWWLPNIDIVIADYAKRFGLGSNILKSTNGIMDILPKGFKYSIKKEYLMNRISAYKLKQLK